MSRVIVRPLNAIGGAGVVTSFSDNFNRANSVNGFGPNWTCAGMDFQGVFSSHGPVGISVNQMVWQASAVNQNITEPFGFMPVPPLSGLAQGVSQFSQIQFISSNSLVGTRSMYIGPSVLNGWHDNVGYRMYCLGCFVDDTQSRLILVKWDGAMTTLLNLGVASVAVNDTVRLEARLAVGQVNFTVLRNGTSIGTVSDAGATQSRFGSPGVHRMQYVTAAVPGVSSVAFDNYACGSL